MCCGPALVFSAGAAVCQPDTVMAAATVLTAAAHIHVSLPHLFKDLVLTDSYHMLAVCKLNHRDGKGPVTEQAVVCLFNTRTRMAESLSPDAFSLLEEAY